MSGIPTSEELYRNAVLELQLWLFVNDGEKLYYSITVYHPVKRGTPS